jgi:hypothetical protein
MTSIFLHSTISHLLFPFTDGRASKYPYIVAQVSPKPKRRKRLQNVFLGDRGFPDQSNNCDLVFHDIDGGPILRKLRHPMPDLNGPVDPRFDHPFIAEQHEPLMGKNTDLSHLDPNLQEKIYSVIRE